MKLLKRLNINQNGRAVKIVGLLLPWIIFIGLGVATEVILYQEKVAQQGVDSQNVLSHAGEIRALLESDVNASIHLATGLVSYIQSKDGELNEKELAPWINDLQSQGRNIRNIGIAPDNRLSYIFPRQGNEAAIGLYYPDNKEQWPAVEKVILSKTPSLAGPVALKQGGLGFIYRIPVFLENDRYWGMVSTVLNADVIIQALAQRAAEQGITFALVDTADSSTSHFLFGDKNLALENKSNRSLAHLDIQLPGRQLRLYAKRIEETKILAHQIQRAIGWSIAAVLAILIGLTIRSYRRQHRVFSALAESQNRFLRAFNTAPQGMAMLDRHGKWISVNSTLCNILSHTEKSLLAVNPEIISPRFNQEYLTQHWKLKQHVNTPFEIKLRDAKGNGLICLVSVALVENKDIEKSYWIIQIIDISRRIEAEATLKESAEYTQAILDNVMDGIITATPEGKILTVNPAAKHIWKQAGKDIHKGNFFSLFNADQASEIKEKLIALYANQGTDENWLTHESAFTDQSGELVSIEINIATTERKDQSQLIIVVRDISERKRLEALKNEFVSIVSHELRTPLTSIIGSLKLVEGGVFGQLPEAMLKLIRIASQNGQQLALIINDILDMDKLAAGKMEFNIQALALTPQIEQSIEANRAYAEQFKVTYELTQALPDQRIAADEQRMQQVMSNLLSNAAKFSPQEGKVEIRLIEEEHHIRIEVKDDGVGIAEHNQNKIFKKFSQVDGSATRAKGGTGLGLSICKELVERMNGKIGFHSELGKGSTFYFTVPKVGG